MAEKIQEAIKDEELYRDMSEPMPSFDEANAAIKAFMEDVRESRRKHKIRDTYVIVFGTAMGPTGQEAEFMTSGNNGDENKCEQMCAWALGHEQALRQERVGRWMSNAYERGKRAK